MRRPNGLGRWARVDAARLQARLAPGKDPDVPDDYSEGPSAHKPLPPSLTPPWSDAVASGPSQHVLSLGEAAARLNVSRSELEAVIAAGRVEALPTGFTLMIPTREIERLQSTHVKP